MATTRLTYKLVASDVNWMFLSSLWLGCRRKLWNLVTLPLGWADSIDLQGNTPWGNALNQSILKVYIPKKFLVAHHLKKEVRDLLRNRFQVAFPLMNTRKHGRVYHPLSGIKREVRSEIVVNGEGVVECDLHAAYWAILAHLLRRDGFRDEKLISELQNRRFYELFRPSFEQMLDRQNRNLKVEVNKQCLFYRDHRISSRPLWRVLQNNHPQLAEFIRKLRQNNTASQLSDVIQRIEGSIMVDGALVKCFQESGFCISYHDGLMVQQSFAPRAVQIIGEYADARLGFRPPIALKRGEHSVPTPGPPKHSPHSSTEQSFDLRPRRRSQVGNSQIARLNMEISKLLSDSGLEIESMDLGTWTAAGQALAKVHKRLLWALGDWYLHGEESGFLSKNNYEEIAEKFGISKTTLRHAIRVSRKFKNGRRLPDLSWAHHQTVAGRSDADELLRYARKAGLSVKGLREHLKETDERKIAGGDEPQQRTEHDDDREKMDDILHAISELEPSLRETLLADLLCETYMELVENLPEESSKVASDHLWEALDHLASVNLQLKSVG